MRQVSLLDFQTRAIKVLGTVTPGEIILLANPSGPAYFLVPVQGDVAAEHKELRRAMAKISLQNNWLQTKQARTELSGAEIQEEIDSVRVRVQHRETE